MYLRFWPCSKRTSVLVFKVFEKVNIDEDRLSMYVCVSLSVCLYLYVASHILETSEAMAIKFETATASVARIQHVLIILTLTFIQGHTDLDHEINKCSIISETVQAMPIMFAVKIVR